MINENNYSARMFIMGYAVAHKFSYQGVGGGGGGGVWAQKLTKAWDVLCAIIYRWDTL